MVTHSGCINVYSAFKSSVAGIPCLIQPTHITVVKGSYSYNAPSDMDYYGYKEIEFDVLDRRGRYAPWLERKLTDRDRDRIDNEIMEYVGDDQI